MKKEFTTELLKKAADASSDDSKRPAAGSEQPMFYQLRCSKCGEDSLDVIDSGVFLTSPVLGITDDGEIGCSHTAMDGDYQLSVYCRNCENEMWSGGLPQGRGDTENLLEWAKSNGAARTALPFICPQCGAQALYQIERGVEFSYEVVAVCEPDAPDNSSLIAVSHLRHIDGGGPFRYRCDGGHELTKDDGSPVETAEELVEWLKVHRSSEKG